MYGLDDPLANLAHSPPLLPLLAQLIDLRLLSPGHASPLLIRVVPGLDLTLEISRFNILVGLPPSSGRPLLLPGVIGLPLRPSTGNYAVPLGARSACAGRNTIRKGWDHVTL